MTLAVTAERVADLPPAIVYDALYRSYFCNLVSGSDNWPDRFSFVLRGPGWAYARHAELAADPLADDLPPITAGVA